MFLTRELELCNKTLGLYKYQVLHIYSLKYLQNVKNVILIPNHLHMFWIYSFVLDILDNGNDKNTLPFYTKKDFIGLL